MIKIDYTLKDISGEPGPNIYFMGKPDDYSKLSNDLHALGEKPDSIIKLNKINYIEIADNIIITCKSSKNGNTLNKITGKQIIIDLTPTIWRTFIIQTFAISFYPCHDYIDFDNVDLIEDANIIISSEY